MASNLFKSEIGSREKGFLLNIDINGVYITVYPVEDGGLQPFELTDITKILFERGITDYDMEHLVTAIKKAEGVPVSLVDFSAPEAAEEAAEVQPQEPKLTLDIAKDKMTAVLRVESEENSKPVTYHMITSLLNEQGVIFGVSDRAIGELLLLNKKHGSCEGVVAEGKRPQNGRDAEIINHFSQQEKNHPKINEDGRADFKNLNLFTVVSEGDLLQERIPHTMGEAGMNVFGDTIAAKPGKMQMLTPGHNVKIVNEHKLISQINGQLVFEGKRLSVVPFIQINGDVDFSTGNIIFNGSVLIKGDVQQGFTVRADGDIIINGSVCGGIVEGNDITIKGGIQGLNSGWVEARRDLISGFAENAKVTAARNIEIKEAVLHSQVNAGKSIKILGRRGTVVGGHLAAGELIDVKTAGNMMNTATTLEVGVNPLLRKKIDAARIELGKAEAALVDAKRALSVLKSTPRDRMSPDRQEMLGRLLRAQFPLETQIKELKSSIELLESEEESLRAGKVKILDCAYSGVRILVDSSVRSLSDTVKHSTFYNDDGDVRVGPY